MCKQCCEGEELNHCCNHINTCGDNSEITCCNCKCKKLKSNKMSSPQNAVLRFAIVMGMLAAVMAILYFTPLPDPNLKSCDRPCHDLEWPMICRVRLEIEKSPYHPNETFTINGKIPGPQIRVCQNDILVVDVINRIPEHSLTIHWRGQPNEETPFMDGVPLVTQCPIPSYTTFQYKLRASAPGTHMYHAFSDDKRSGGLFGSLIVKQTERKEPHSNLYDVDSGESVGLISESSQQGKMLINGVHDYTFDLRGQKGMINRKRGRYRFRLGYSGGHKGCPIRVTIDDHPLRIISLDGNPIKGYEAGSVILGKGERVDFVLKGNAKPSGTPKSYLRVKSECGSETKALIRFDNDNQVDDDGGEPQVTSEGFKRTFDTGPNCERGSGRVCLRDAQSLGKIGPLGMKEHDGVVEKVVYLALGARGQSSTTDSTTVYGINNLTFSFPSSPLVTQLGQVPLQSVCDAANAPEKCRLDPILCDCVHVEFLQQGTHAEVVLINTDDKEEHVFHLHGHHFQVVGYKQFDSPPGRDEVISLDADKMLFDRNFNNPAMKDTIRVPKNGVVALRFFANNPGFWMLRDENSKGWTRGMDIVFQVGYYSKMVSVPSNFPTCGNYIGPNFFLI